MGESRASVPVVRILAPRNVVVSHPFVRGNLDIRWDDTSQLNPAILGYNVYRSQVELTETFRRVNNDLVQTNFFRDSLRDDVVIEDVTSQFSKIEDYQGDPNDRFDLIGINTHRWLIVDPDEVVSQQRSLRFRDGFGLNRLAYVESRFLLSGDFDVEVSYRVKGLDEPETGEAGGFLWLTIKGEGSVRFMRRRTPAEDDLVVERIAADGTVAILESRPATDLGNGRDVGRLRIIRSDSAFTFAYDDGDEFIVLHTELDLSDELVQVRMGGISGANDSALSVNTLFEFQDWVIHEAGGIKAWTSPDPNMWLRGGEQSPVDQLRVDSAFIIQLENFPVVDDRGHARPTDDPAFVKVLVDGREADVTVLNGVQGRIAVASFPVWDDILRRFIDRPIPSFCSKVTVEYKTTTNIADTSLDKKLFYRVTAVCDGGEETPLSQAAPARLGGDGLTYYWEEAILRNKWILEQGGHRTQIFIQKSVGEPCPCAQQTAHTHDHPENDCNVCFGTGFVGGYEGPFDSIVSPPFAEMKVEYQERGSRLIKQPEVWMTPTPLISQRDFMVLRDGKCYAIGPVTQVEARNHTVLQQHFSISVLDTTDIRYRFLEQKVYENVVPTEAQKSLKGTTQHPLGKEIRQDGSSRKHSIRKTPADITFENHLY